MRRFRKIRRGVWTYERHVVLYYGWIPGYRARLKVTRLALRPPFVKTYITDPDEPQAVRR